MLLATTSEKAILAQRLLPRSFTFGFDRNIHAKYEVSTGISNGSKVIGTVNVDETERTTICPGPDLLMQGHKTSTKIDGSSTNCSLCVIPCG